ACWRRSSRTTGSGSTGRGASRWAAARRRAKRPSRCGTWAPRARRSRRGRRSSTPSSPPPSSGTSTKENAVEFLSRRRFLQDSACGFGALAFAGLGAGRALSAATDPLAPKLPHHAAKAKRVIFLFMQGGVSHVDSYDYKPRLDRDDGKMMNFDDARQIANTGQRQTSQRIMKPLWKFAQHGQSGRWASNLFPEINKHVDDLC